MIRTAGGGIVVDVRVIPRAAKAGLAGTRGESLLVRLQAPPVDGAANTELIALLATVLDVPKRSVSILSGETSRQKRVSISGIDAAVAAARLSAARNA